MLCLSQPSTVAWHCNAVIPLSTWYNVAACVVVLRPQSLYLSRMNHADTGCAGCRWVERTFFHEEHTHSWRSRNASRPRAERFLNYDRLASEVVFCSIWILGALCNFAVSHGCQPGETSLMWRISWQSFVWWLPHTNNGESIWTYRSPYTRSSMERTVPVATTHL